MQDNTLTTSLHLKTVETVLTYESSKQKQTGLCLDGSFIFFSVKHLLKYLLAFLCTVLISWSCYFLKREASFCADPLGIFPQKTGSHACQL